MAFDAFLHKMGLESMSVNPTREEMLKIRQAWTLYQNSLPMSMDDGLDAVRQKFIAYNQQVNGGQGAFGRVNKAGVETFDSLLVSDTIFATGFAPYTEGKQYKANPLTPNQIGTMDISGLASPCIWEFVLFATSSGVPSGVLPLSGGLTAGEFYKRSSTTGGLKITVIDTLLPMTFSASGDLTYTNKTGATIEAIFLSTRTL